MAIIPSLEKNQIADMLKQTYQEFEEKTGSVPEWLKVMAHSPRIAKNFTNLFYSVMNRGDINPYLKWKMAYTVSQELRCEFCVDVTIKMLKKFGADAKMINKIKNRVDLSTEEKDVLDLVRDVTDDANLQNPKVLDNLKKRFSPKQIIEIVSVIGLFNYINRFNNTLAVLPE